MPKWNDRYTKELATKTKIEIPDQIDKEEDALIGPVHVPVETSEIIRDKHKKTGPKGEYKILIQRSPWRRYRYYTNSRDKVFPEPIWEVSGHFRTAGERQDNLENILNQNHIWGNIYYQYIRPAYMFEEPDGTLSDITYHKYFGNPYRGEWLWKVPIFGQSDFKYLTAKYLKEHSEDFIWKPMRFRGLDYLWPHINLGGKEVRIKGIERGRHGWNEQIKKKIL